MLSPSLRLILSLLSVFRFLASGMRVDMGFCNLKLKLLRQRMWLGKDDMMRTPFCVVECGSNSHTRKDTTSCFLKVVTLGYL
jgi:hypothetical protein